MLSVSVCASKIWWCMLLDGDDFPVMLFSRVINSKTKFICRSLAWIVICLTLHWTPVDWKLSWNYLLIWLAHHHLIPVVFHPWLLCAPAKAQMLGYKNRWKWHKTHAVQEVLSVGQSAEVRERKKTQRKPTAKTHWDLHQPNPAALTSGHISVARNREWENRGKIWLCVSLSEKKEKDREKPNPSPFLTRQQTPSVHKRASVSKKKKKHKTLESWKKRVVNKVGVGHSSPLIEETRLCLWQCVHSNYREKDWWQNWLIAHLCYLICSLWVPSLVIGLWLCQH